MVCKQQLGAPDRRFERLRVGQVHCANRRFAKMANNAATHKIMAGEHLDHSAVGSGIQPLEQTYRFGMDEGKPPTIHVGTGQANVRRRLPDKNLALAG